MKLIIFATFLAVIHSSSAATYDLSPGNPFPAISLPSISSGENTAFKDHLGEKLMLHLFASW